MTDQTLFESSPLPSLVYEVATRRFLAVNEAARRHYEGAQSDFFSSTVDFIRLPEEKPRAPSPTGEITFGRSIERHRTFLGRIFLAEVVTSPVMFEERPAVLMLILKSEALGDRLDQDISDLRKRWLNLPESERRSRELVESSPSQLEVLASCVARLSDIVLILEVSSFPDSGTRVLYVNDAFVERTGYAREEVLGRSPQFLHGPYTQSDALRRIRAAMKLGHPIREELISYAKDGREFWLEQEIAPVTDANGGLTHWVAIGRDVSERRKAEIALSESHRALRTLSECNEALARCECESELLAEICRITVEVGGYKLTVVGFPQNDADRTILPVAYAGPASDYVAGLRVSWDPESPHGRGPAGRVIRSGQPYFAPDLDRVNGFEPWAPMAARHGLHGLVCLPLKLKGQVIGVLALYLAEARQIFEEEARFLRDLADNLAFGISAIRGRTERRKLHETVVAIARGISTNVRSAFFETLTSSMVDALGADGGLIARIDRAGTAAETLCAVLGGKPAPGLVFPAGYLLPIWPQNHDVWMIAEDSLPAELAPHSQHLEGGCSIAEKLRDPSGALIGVIWVLFRAPTANYELASSTLRIFASRAAAELERQKADELLREQASLLDNAQDAIIVSSLNHRVMYWNRGAERLYGWTAEEMTSGTVSASFTSEATRQERALASTLRQGEWMGTLEQLTKSGEKKMVQSRWTLLRDSRGAPKSILIINTDITDHKRLERQLFRAQRMESLGTLAGGLAHDLNNVLAPILMSIEYLQAGEQDASRLDALATIEKSARRGAAMVKQVLSFARGYEGEQIDVPICGLLAEIEHIMKETLLKTIDVELRITSRLWLVHGDPTQIHQVLMNLCVNARDAMTAGGKLTLSAQNLRVDEAYARMNIDAREGPYVRIDVEDTGSGIAPEHVERIFEPFFTTKEVNQGTGLGLSTCLAIVKGHGGFMRVYSERGKGTRMRVYLPASPESSWSEAAPDESVLPRGNGELILVIDDEENIRHITRVTLEKFGYRALVAAEGTTGVACYAMRSSEIAAVVTDMMMPLMDGVTTIQVLKKMNRHLPIIATSGLNMNQFKAKAEFAAANAFIAKPFKAEQLLNTLAEVMRRETGAE